MVPEVWTSWPSSTHWMANSVLGERGEDDAEGGTCGLVDVVISVMYHSMSLTNLGICSW